MAKFTRLAAAAGLVALGVSAGLAARPDGPPRAASGESDQIVAARAEQVQRLADLTVYLEMRTKAGISRPYLLQLLRAKLQVARAEAAATDAEKLAMYQSALESVHKADAGIEDMRSAGTIGGQGGMSTDDFQTMTVEIIQQTAELKIAVARLEAKLAR